MEFHIFEIHDKWSLRTNPLNYDAEDEDEAISTARQHAQTRKEGTTVGLFKKDSDGKPHAIVGWRVIPNGKLRKQSPEDIKSQFRLTNRDFEYAKMQP